MKQAKDIFSIQPVVEGKRILHANSVWNPAEMLTTSEGTWGHILEKNPTNAKFVIRNTQKNREPKIASI